MKVSLIIIVLFCVQNLHAQNEQIELINFKLELYKDEILRHQKEILNHKSVIRDLEDSISIAQNKIDSIKFYATIKSDSDLVYKTTVNTYTSLKAEPKFYSDNVCSIASGETIKIFDYSETYYKAHYKNFYGYISEDVVVENEELLRLKKMRMLEKEDVIKQYSNLLDRIVEEGLKEVDNQNELTLDAQNIPMEKDQLIKKYGLENGMNIHLKKLWIGMTSVMIIEGWGFPDEINKTVGSWGEYEQWIYGDSFYLYFENHILTSWQEFSN